MDEKIELQKLKKEYPDVFKNIPNEITKVILSDETSLKIAGICLRNGIEEEGKIEKIAYYINLVLLRQLPPKTLSKTLEREVKIDAKKAEKISLEVNKTIFFQIKDNLAKFYKPIKSSVKPEKPLSPPEEKPKKSPSKDVYRELID